MINKSILSKTRKKNQYKKLDHDLDVDILIIGGGITGINVLYKLKDENVCLVERNTIASGVTLNTTGKITYLQDILFKIIDKHGLSKASIYLKSQIDAINEIKKIILDNNIKCDFEKSRSYLFVQNDENINKLKSVKDLFIRNNINVFENNIPLVDSKYSISVDDTYLFNPIKYIDGLCSLIDRDKIYENTNVIDIKYENNRYTCLTDNKKIIAKKVVLACHYPYFINPFFFPMKAYLEKSYVMAFKKKINNLSLISIDSPTISMRNYKNNLIYLGESHNICNRVDDEDNFSKLLGNVCEDVDYLWSNIDIMTNDYLPFMGYIKDNLILMTGFNTWGMTNSVLSGLLIKDLISKKENKYLKLFDPKRGLDVLRMVSDSFSSIKGYYDGVMCKNKKVIYTKISGVDVIIYKDNDKEYIVKRKCPHAKCNLIFNEVEKTFDCPCHSSRFDLEGNVISGPSKYNISFIRNS